MTIFYKRRIIWMAFPLNDEIDSDLVYYSKSKRKFDYQIFTNSSPSLTMDQRRKHVAYYLKVKANKIKLERA